jgi:hypothetical protein
MLLINFMKRGINSMNLIVEKKNVYGVERVYPVCNKAKILTALTGNKTLLDVDIKLIKQLGYTLTTKREEI